MHTDKKTFDTEGPARQSNGQAFLSSQLEQPVAIDQDPSKLYVIKRNGETVPYDVEKIVVAISKAYLAVEGGTAAESSRVHELADRLAAEITDNFRSGHLGRPINIEHIQDRVELVLMRSGEHQVARSYVLYREERAKEREGKDSRKKQLRVKEETILITQPDGSQTEVAKKLFADLIARACKNIKDVDSKLLTAECMKGFYKGMTIKDVNEALIMTTRTFIEHEPQYTYVAARLLLNRLTREVLPFLGVLAEVDFTDLPNHYGDAFKRSIRKGIELGLLNEELAHYDLDKLATALDGQRDDQFSYIGLQILYDRYFLHSADVRFELPQIFFMRVAMGIAIKEIEREKRAIEFYNLLSQFDYMCSTPSLFNAGTKHSQLSSCYLTTVSDDLHSIYKAISDNAMLSKWAGGLGNDWTMVRALGSHIKGTNGRSQGVVPFLKVADATAVAVNQGGKRKGALCSYLETWHMDIEEFLELRKNTGDDRRRTHDMNTANWVPDLFMKRLREDGEWTLFSPSDAVDLHDSYGKRFEKSYLEYERQAKEGKIKNFKKVAAKDLWRKMLSMLYETGHPWITFKDTCNIRSPQQHCGVVHSSNLCTEITLNTSPAEIAVCNLGSVNLLRHFNKGKLDTAKLRETVRTAVRMLDNVIDINYYPVAEARNSNFKHRPIGLGLMGFQDVLHQAHIPNASDEALELADRTMEQLSYFALEASSDLAVERGGYHSYEGSLWSQGILPIDSIELLKKERGAEFVELDDSATLDWEALRKKIKQHKMRNSNVLAIAPTATIANIVGVSQSIEPLFQNLYVKSNLSGEFTIVNSYLVNDLKKLDLWDNVMLNDIKYYEGSVQDIGRIPDEIKKLYLTAFELDPSWLIEAAARRQKWIDQAQSLNIYIAEPSGKKLDEIYQLAWQRGLKTTYYLRSRSKTRTEKSTLDRTNLNRVSLQNGSEDHNGNGEVAKQMANGSDEPLVAAAACAIDNPDCEACQ